MSPLYLDLLNRFLSVELAEPAIGPSAVDGGQGGMFQQHLAQAVQSADIVVDTDRPAPAEAHSDAHRQSAAEGRSSAAARDDRTPEETEPGSKEQGRPAAETPAETAPKDGPIQTDRTLAGEDQKSDNHAETDAVGTAETPDAGPAAETAAEAGDEGGRPASDEEVVEPMRRGPTPRQAKPRSDLTDKPTSGCQEEAARAEPEIAAEQSAAKSPKTGTNDPPQARKAEQVREDSTQPQPPAESVQQPPEPFGAEIEAAHAQPSASAPADPLPPNASQEAEEPESDPRRRPRRKGASDPLGSGPSDRHTAEHVREAKPNPAQQSRGTDPQPVRPAEVRAQTVDVFREGLQPTTEATSVGESNTDAGPTLHVEPKQGPRQAPAAPGRESSASEQADRARFVQRVARAFESAGDRGGTVRLRLHPPDLGSLRLDVAVRNGTMNARLEVETDTARTMLLDSLPALRERLAEQDITVGRFEVALADRSSGGSPERPGGHPQPSGHPPSNASHSGPDADREEEPARESRPPVRLSEENRLDVTI